MKIIVTGGSGLLGRKITAILSENHETIGTYNNKQIDGGIRLDLTDFAKVREKFAEIKPDAIIHTAAMTGIEESEENKFQAYLINVVTSFHLADICRRHDARMVYISSDYVFSGRNSPYREDAIPHPVNYYGETKLWGEEMVRRGLDTAIIARVPIMYGFNDRTDKETVVSSAIKKMSSGSMACVDNARMKYPLLIDDAARNLEMLLESNVSGNVHLCSGEGMTRYEWVLKTVEVFGLPKELVGIKNEEFGPGRPERPVDVNLVNTRVKDLRFHTVEEGLRIIKRQMEEQE